MAFIFPPGFEKKHDGESVRRAIVGASRPKSNRGPRRIACVEARFQPSPRFWPFSASRRRQPIPPRPSGAKEIEGLYAAYLSKAAIDKGVVAVAPQGEDYLVTWDLQKAIAAAGGPADVVKIAPFVLPHDADCRRRLDHKASGLPTLTIGPTGQDLREGGVIAFDGFNFDSLFDPAATDFWRGKLELAALNADLTAHSGDDLKHMKIAENGVAGEMRIKPGEDADSVDVGLTQTVESASEVTAAAGGDDAGQSEASELRQGAAVGDSSVTGLKAAAFGDLWRFLVAHADDGAPAPETLKPKLEALLPLWRDMKSRIALDQIAVAFPGGNLTIKSLGQEVKISGLAAQSSAEIGLAVKDLALDIEAAPDWAKAAWPASLQLRVSAGVDGLDQAARLALDEPEFLKSGALSDDTKDALTRALTQGRPHVTISETRLSTPLVEATVEGQAEFGADGAEAHAKVTADNLDKVLELLAKVSEDEPDARQALFVATFIKGLAKQEDGHLAWDIEYAPPDAVIVNGQRLGGTDAP